MSGAERREQRKKQERLAAAKAVAAARNQGNDRRKILIGIACVAVLALAVIGGVIWAGSKDAKDQAKGPTVTQSSGISAPIQREEGTVVIGDASAKATIDVYEDFLCPYCKEFGVRYDEQIQREVEAKNLRVRVHMLPLLMRASNPPGYSLDAANAALCTVEQNKYWQYYKSLFASQPKEGRAGYTKAELIQLGRDVGVTGEEFVSCVNGSKNNAAAEAELAKAKSLSFFKGTPTVASGDQLIDINNPDWLSNLINSAKAPSTNQ